MTAWLQAELPQHLGEDRGAASGASYWARRYIIEEIADSQLRRKWLAWLDSQL